MGRSWLDVETGMREMGSADGFMGHRPHDYAALAEGWRELAGQHGWECRDFAGWDGYGLMTLVNGDGGGIYLSAGIHGDEAAAPWGLLEWARQRGSRLQDRAFRIFPCLNPWGLDTNCRFDATGVDLNRAFHDGNHPLIGAWRSELGSQRFACAVCLHEDYDAAGMYLYELAPGSRMGSELLRECEDLMNRQPDGQVEEFESENGVVKVPPNLEVVVESLGEQLPEAIYLFLHHTDWSLTFETPSEMGWRERVKAHARFVAAVEGRCHGAEGNGCV